MKLKRLQFADVAEIQIGEKFSAKFQKLYDRAKACIYASGAYFKKKKVRDFLICLRFH